MAIQTFGEFLSDRRRILGMSQIEFAERYHFKQSDIQSYEAGMFRAPRSERTLLRLATALQLAPNSKEWEHFQDLAALSRGALPRDVTKNKELCGQVAVVVTTLRNMDRNKRKKLIHALQEEQGLLPELEK